MDKKEFEQKLSAVAEWRYPKIVLDGVERRRRRGRPSKEELQEQQEEQHMYDLFNGVNPTQPPELTKIKPCETLCPNCHKSVVGNCHVEKRFVVTMKTPHWREHCLTCDHWRNPYTGVFDVKASDAGTVWGLYLRASKEHRQKVKEKFQKQQLSATFSLGENAQE